MLKIHLSMKKICFWFFPETDRESKSENRTYYISLIILRIREMRHPDFREYVTSLYFYRHLQWPVASVQLQQYTIRFTLASMNLAQLHRSQCLVLLRWRVCVLLESRSIGINPCVIFFLGKKKGRSNRWFAVKRCVLLVFLLLINTSAIVIVYLFGNQRATIVIIILAKAKDILCAVIIPFYYVYKICTCYNGKRPLLNGDKKTIVSIIPVYKETLEEIAYTMDSIICNSIKMYQMLVVIICDGSIPEVDSLIDRKKAVESNLQYRSWKDADVGCEVTMVIVEEHHWSSSKKIEIWKRKIVLY